MMDAQAMFNLFVSIVGAAGGWWLNTVWRAVSDLQRQDRELADKLGRVEVLVAGDYVRKDEFLSRVDAMETHLVRKLDQIDAKVDGKVDK